MYTYVYICIHMYTYVYIHTYIHTLPYLTLPYLTLPYIHTYIHTLHTYIHTYMYRSHYIPIEWLVATYDPPHVFFPKLLLFTLAELFTTFAALFFELTDLLSGLVRGSGFWGHHQTIRACFFFVYPMATMVAIPTVWRVLCIYMSIYIYIADGLLIVYI